MGINTPTPHPTALLELYDTARGLLIPRLTTQQRNAITNPAHALIIFNIDSFCLEVYDTATQKWWTISCPTKGCATAPPAPTAQPATNITATTFDANWSASFGATTYFLDVATDPNFTSFVPGYNNLNVGNVLTYTVSGLTCNTTYYYRVRASNACGISVSSNVVSVTTDSVCPVIYVIGGYNAGYRNENEAYNPATNTWTAKASMPTPRYGLSSATVNGIIYVFGGWNGVNYLSTNEAYDPATNTWTSKAPMPTARYYHTSSAVNGIIYVIGGDNGTYLSVNEAYDPATNTWTTKAPMPTPRMGHAASVVNGVIYVIGGWNGNNVSANEAYDPLTNTWSVKSPLPTPRFALTSSAVNNIIYVIGGWDGAGSCCLSINEAYDPATDTWATKAPMPTGRYELTSSVVGNIIYVIGGYSFSGFNLNEAYDPITDSWTTKAPLPTPRYGLTSSAVP